MHPTHGAGQITGVTKMDVVEGFNRYYVIEFLTKRLTVHVPIRNVDESSIRKVMSENKVDHVFQTLQSTPKPLPDHFKARRKKIEGLLQSSLPVKIAEAVRELAWRDHDNGLSNFENKLLSQGRDMLVTEIALASDQSKIEAQEEIERALAVGIQAKEKENGKEPELN